MKWHGCKPRGHSHLKIISSYFAFCLCIILTCTGSLGKLIEENNITQMNTTIGLMAEKMNNSIQIMTGYVQEIAEILSARDTMDLWQNYRELQNGIEKLPFTSVGLLSCTGTIYGKPGEQHDMKKYGFPQLAAESEGVYITDPYRSSALGSNVITMFHPFYHDGVRAGSVFVTYPLEEIQVLAHTNILRDETEIFLMNAFSGNYIRCSGSAGLPAGSWNNVKLVKNRISCDGGYNYDTWEQGMRDGMQRDILCLKIDGVAYTQAYENIESMDGWYVVVRIPNNSLSTVMQEYSKTITSAAILLIGATLIVLVVFLREEMSEKRELRQLSSVDPLTQTMNRRAFHAQTEKFFRDAGNRRHGVLMFLDLDHFKQINDTYGHDAGDQLLHHFAVSLQSIFCRDSLIARIGGDEFIIFLTDPPDREAIAIMMARLKNALEDIPLKDCGRLTVHYSAGLAEYPADAKDLELLKKAADSALYYVKRTTKNTYCWYSQIPAEEIPEGKGKES